MSPGGGGIDYCQKIAHLLDFEGDYPHQDVEVAFTKVLIITGLAQSNKFLPIPKLSFTFLLPSFAYPDSINS